MNIDKINVGGSPDDGNGDNLRNAFIKVNENYDVIDIDKADKASTYTKQEVNDLIPDTSSFAKETDLVSGLALKADKTTTFTKTEVNTLLNTKADKSNTYTKSDIDSTFADVNSDISNLQTNKANKSETYTKPEVDSLVSTKANTSDLNALQTLVNTKADKSTTYSKTEVNALIDGVEVDLSEYYNKYETYSKSEVNNLIDGVEVDLSEYYTKPQADAKFGTIKTVNGNLPDPNGNIVVEAGGGSGGGSQTLDDVLGEGNVSTKKIVLKYTDDSTGQTNTYSDFGMTVTKTADGTPYGGLEIYPTYSEFYHEDGNIVVSATEVQISVPVILPSATDDTQAPNLGQVNGLISTVETTLDNKITDLTTVVNTKANTTDLNGMVKSVNGVIADGSGAVIIPIGIEEAPKNGKSYVRKDGVWAELPSTLILTAPNGDIFSLSVDNDASLVTTKIN